MLKWIDNFKEIDNLIFWDIGANIGLYSIYAAVKHREAKIISFEPSTSNLRSLSRNISINKFEDQITIHQLPLSKLKNQHALFEESEFIEGWAMNTFDEGIDYEGQKIKSKNKYKIFGTNINYLIKNNILDIPDYIKIDVDGIEHLILEGAKEITSRATSAFVKSTITSTLSSVDARSEYKFTFPDEVLM